MFKLFIYLISIIISTFAVSGLNINHIFKNNHKNEAKCFYFLLVVTFSYLLSQFLLEISSINLMPNL